MNKGKRTWNFDKDKMLIELVKSNPGLYNLQSPYYNDNNYKKMVWDEIGKAVGRQVSSCKSRWNNIRDNYRKSVKKTATMSEQNAKNIKIYKYSKQLNFIKKYFDEGEIKGNIEKQENEDGKQDHEIEDEYEIENRTDEAEEPNVSNVSEDLQSQPLLTPTYKNTFESTTSRSGISSKKRKNPKQTASAILMEYLIKKYENQSTTSTSNASQHPVDAFLASVAPTLKTLNPYFLNLAKSEIFATVQRYEMKMLMEQHSHQERYDQHFASNMRSTSRTPTSISTPLSSPTSFVDQENVKLQHLQPAHEVSSPPVTVPNSITENALQNYDLHFDTN